MCSQCDYENLLAMTHLEVTENRLKVLEVIGNSASPLSADVIFKTLRRICPMNRVTVYRILDLLVENSLVDRISSGGRAFYYGLAPNEHHEPHPHFYCTQCGKMNCLDPAAMTVNTDPLKKTFQGRIHKVEVRVDGICDKCLAS